MFCYKDKTFCSSPNCQNKCERQFTEHDRAQATAWWGGEDFPLSTADFCGDEIDE